MKTEFYTHNRNNSSGGSLNPEYIYAPNIKAPTYVKEKLLELKAVIKLHTLIVGDFSIPL